MIENGYAVYRPSFVERFWMRLGYRYHLGEDAKDIENLPGWMCTETRMRFSIMDRIRLLLSGRLHIKLVQHLPVKCDFSRNRLDWQIERPSLRSKKCR